MRCFALSTAETYDLQGFASTLGGLGTIDFYTDALHVGNKEWNFFIFRYGCLVFWNVPLDEEAKILALLKNFSHNLISCVSEEFEYSFGRTPRFFQDKITLAQTRSHVLQMLAVSYGLSQVIKLAAFEVSIDKTIEMTKTIPKELARYGKISLSRKEISKRVGELFIKRNSVNLHSDILDAPVFIWDHPEYEALYTMTTNDLELHNRTAVLNRRLDIIKELFDMMRDELDNRHSMMLEYVIVFLIMMEVFLTCVIDVFHLI
jgi:uncharacterized Rmd1/YagE family protein